MVSPYTPLNVLITECSSHLPSVPFNSEQRTVYKQFADQHRGHRIDQTKTWPDPSVGTTRSADFSYPSVFGSPRQTANGEQCGRGCPANRNQRTANCLQTGRKQFVKSSPFAANGTAGMSPFPGTYFSKGMEVFLQQKKSNFISIFTLSNSSLFYIFF